MYTLVDPFKLSAAIAIIVTIWALIDCIRNENEKPKLWMFLILFLGIFGAVPYFIRLRRKGRKVFNLKTD